MDADSQYEYSAACMLSGMALTKEEVLERLHNAGDTLVLGDADGVFNMALALIGDQDTCYHKPGRASQTSLRLQAAGRARIVLQATRLASTREVRSDGWEARPEDLKSNRALTRSDITSAHCFLCVDSRMADLSLFGLASALDPQAEETVD
eukprot:6213620-Pleurochrysis_carterae.AAC.4